MEPDINALLFAVPLFGGMLILLEIGRRLGIRRRPKESEGERGSLGTIEGAMCPIWISGGIHILGRGIAVQREADIDCRGS
jgi:hypothetical protein